MSNFISKVIGRMETLAKKENCNHFTALIFNANALNKERRIEMPSGQNKLIFLKRLNKMQQILSLLMTILVFSLKTTFSPSSTASQPIMKISIINQSINKEMHVRKVRITIPFNIFFPFLFCLLCVF